MIDEGDECRLNARPVRDGKVGLPKAPVSFWLGIAMFEVVGDHLLRHEDARRVGPQSGTSPNCSQKI
jgi:hypothetical protein